MYTLLTPPAAEPLSVEDVKSALRVDHDNDDALLGEMIATARTFLERRLDRAFLTQSWRARLEQEVPGRVPLRPGPVASVSSVTVTNDAGEENILSANDFRLCETNPSYLLFENGLSSDTRQVAIVFSAGTSLVSDIPADLLRALYLLTAHYYEERELFRERRYVAVPHGVEALVEAYREVRL